MQPVSTDFSSAQIGSAGARWMRVALQVNPYGYQGKNQPSTHYPDEAAYNAALIAELRRNSIEVIGITDHWCAQTARGLIDACEAAGVVALPGFEANSREGVHLLVLFPQGTDLGVVDAAIGACGAVPAGPAGALGKPMAEIADEMAQRGALVIAAHANTPNTGLLGGQSGGTRAAMWCHENLAAAAISPGQALSPVVQSIIENKDAQCKRNHELAVIHADDICHPSRLSQTGATTWVKMSAPSADSLHLALRTPRTRIRVVDPTASGHPTLVSIAWQGGFLDGLSLPLSASLTALIGGRGTGKSTVIESLRYALDLPPIAPRAQADHKDFLDKVLKTASKVSVRMAIHRPVYAEYLVERTVPHPPVVKDSAGTVLAQSPLDILGPVEIFSQHELAELSDDQVYVAQLLDRFSGTDPDEDARARVARELEENRGQQLQVIKRIGEIEDQLAELPKLKEQLAFFETQGINDSLAAQKTLQREVGIYATAASRLANVSEKLAGVDLSEILDAAFVAPAVITGLPRHERLAEIAPILEQLRTDVATAFTAAQAGLEQAGLALAASKTQWETETAELRAEYETVVRSLQDAGLDASRYLALGKRIEDLETASGERQQLDQRLVGLRATRRQLLSDSVDLDQASWQRLRSAATSANDHVRGYVVVKPMRSTDRSDLEALINDHVPRQKTQIIAALQADNFSPLAFAAACRDGAPALEAYGIRGAQAAALVSAGEDLFMQLEEQHIGLAAEAQLNVSTNGRATYRSLADLSKGQKATALLLLLLTDAASPLIIDQPEDNLDNQFVYGGIVPRLRELKDARQVIIATHNANLPVLGDAELVIALEAHDTHGGIKDGGLGSIDDASVRGLAGDLLEGGREAFVARRHIYGY
jgi:energy-coupling factor transporter ATP-binding protein EcfA2